MKRRDWLCKMCGDVMIKTSDQYMTCPKRHGLLLPLWCVSDLPRAVRFDYKRFVISGIISCWEYVPHAHKGCLGHAPEPNHVVAAVRLAHGIRPMTFRQVKPPRSKT